MHLPRPVHLQTLCTAFRHFPGLEYVAQRAVPLHHLGSRRADESISLPLNVRMPEPLIKRRYPLFRAIWRSSAALRASRLPHILQGRYASASPCASAEYRQKLHGERGTIRQAASGFPSRHMVWTFFSQLQPTSAEADEALGIGRAGEQGMQLLAIASLDPSPHATLFFTPQM